MLAHTPSDIAQYFRDQRKLKSITQTSMAKDIVIRQDTISSFENKPNKVRLETLIKLLSALDLELHIIPKNQTENISNTSLWAEEW